VRRAGACALPPLALACAVVGRRILGGRKLLRRRPVRRKLLPDLQLYLSRTVFEYFDDVVLGVQTFNVMGLDDLGANVEQVALTASLEGGSE
jgi:hypothetical protein